MFYIQLKTYYQNIPTSVYYIQIKYALRIYYQTKAYFMKHPQEINNFEDINIPHNSMSALNEINFELSYLVRKTYQTFLFIFHKIFPHHQLYQIYIGRSEISIRSTFRTDFSSSSKLPLFVDAVTTLKWEIIFS